MTPIDQGFNDIGSSQSSLFSIAIRFHPNPDPDPDKRSSRDDDVSTARVQAEKLSRKNSVSGAWHSLRASLPAAQLTGPGADPSQERLKSIPTALWQNRSPSLFAAVGWGEGGCFFFVVHQKRGLCPSRSVGVHDVCNNHMVGLLLQGLWRSECSVEFPPRVLIWRGVSRSHPGSYGVFNRQTVEVMRINQINHICTYCTTQKNYTSSSFW